ncbi:MAG: phenylalanine--tRNA ligase subunit beta [Ignavibacteriales bacterium]|nr:phenylalanine--tRNA ligase subunit beta [Ignavibacteriales bacterium]
MRISLNWLKQYVEINQTPEELAHSLTMLGLEVESIERLGDKYNNFFVGKVVNVQKHPKADKLTVCQVDVGEKTLQIVCGAPNIAENQIVAVGLEGAIVPKNQHDPEGKPFQLSKVSLRGTESNGMICSEYELDLGEDKDGILILKINAPIGTPLSKYLDLDDIIFEIGVTPNRPDALSHIGIAREVATIQNKTISLPVTKVIEDTAKISSKVSIKIEDPDNCPRYSARLLTDLKIKSSPEWLKQRLKSIDIRSVNNIVDITNYVMMECGHPLHAFDYDKLEQGMIVIKCAEENQPFITLDHKERKLRKDTLMICDSHKPIAIAGVMGGENSEITKDTKTILLESAYFLPRSIRKTSKHFSLVSDASQRFERGADPNGTIWAINRAAQLIQEIAGGKVLNGIIDVYPKIVEGEKVILRLSKLIEIVGITIPKEMVIEILSKLSIKVIDISRRENDDTIIVQTPTFRPDLQLEIDIIEEVARIYGYDNIPVHQASLIKFSENAPIKNQISEMKAHFIGAGMSEIITNSMQTIQTALLSSPHPVQISNPISRDMESLRTSLLPNMLEVIRENIFRGTTLVRLFEFGNIYFNNPYIAGKYLKEYQEVAMLTIGLSGSANRVNWDEKSRFYDIFDIKGEIESFFEKISLDNIKFIPYSTTNALSESDLRIEINSEYIGTIGMIRKDVLKRFGIEQDVVFADIDVDKIIKLADIKKKFMSLSKFPSVIRDIALVVHRTVQMDRIEEVIKQYGSELLRKVELFDRYTGEQIGKDNVSYAFSLEFISSDHTLTQNEVDKVFNNITKKLEQQLKAVIRQ